METNKPKTVYLKDYKKSDYTIKSCGLVFHLDAESTCIESTLDIIFNSDDVNQKELRLDCKDIEIISLFVDGHKLSDNEWYTEPDCLFLKTPPSSSFQFKSIHTISPAKNRALEGLYISSGNFCTQNEAEGFRRITPFLDRPDVMSTYTVTIIADKNKYPILLCNGNRKESCDLLDGKHQVIWEDPHPKPSYLFALVAGDLGLIRDTFVTKSGSHVDLEIYTDKGNEHLCDFAMQSLKRAMKWDEDVFGLEYDLDLYMIVAVDDFNMGAMENKGLNIFNSKLILADPKTATDDLFESIEAVVAHEYFHNWTGNRITCRDWFQLTLKEGLTVYRDQRFTADMTQRGVKRIKDASHLISFQFPEDNGPLSHPIQPDHYIEINNFYTQTVYEKGAEVIGMIATLIGEDAFARGITEYFRLYDGQAVTIDEFLQAMENVSDLDTTLFRRWYTTKGTPVVNVSVLYDNDSKVLKLNLSQSIPKNKDAQPLLIPVKAGFCSAKTKNLKIESLDESTTKVGDDFLLILKERSQTFTFKNVEKNDVCSVLRDFSAPVHLEYKLSREMLATQMMSDDDDYIRWNASQQLYSSFIEERIQEFVAHKKSSKLPDLLSTAMDGLLDATVDPMILSWLLNLPAESNTIQKQKKADFENTHKALKSLRSQIAEKLETKIHARFLVAKKDSQLHSKKGVASRRLKNVLLRYLTSIDSKKYLEMCLEEQMQASNLTEELAAFSCLINTDSEFREKSMQCFHKKWSANTRVMDYYFSNLASSSHTDTLELVIGLENDSAFRFDNPNKIRSLYGSFCRNALVFNQTDGRAYTIIGDVICRLDVINPSIAAGLCRAFTRTGNLDESRKSKIKDVLEKIQSQEKISPDLFEISQACLRALD